MRQRERTKRDRSEELVEEGSLKKKGFRLTYDQYKSPYEGVTDFNSEPSFDRHVALLASANTDAQRANRAIHLQKTYGNQYVQRLVETMKVKSKQSNDLTADELINGIQKSEPVIHKR